MNVEIVGINRIGFDSSPDIQLMTSGKTIPLVQDNSTANVWRSWDATWRDVRILDSSNRLVSVFNLSAHDLAAESNYETLRAMFISAAQACDSDQNGLPDHWENLYLKRLGNGRDDDPDGDGFSNWLELAFATDPLDPASYPRFQLSFTRSKQLIVSFPRWSGTAGSYLVDLSTNLMDWSSAASALQKTTLNLYDGTGRSKSSYTVLKNSFLQPNAFIRVGAQAK